MAEWIRAGLDVLLIMMVGAGLWQAGRLIGHLTNLRASRGEMERFVRDFNATVIRAEIGIKGLRNAARESGDDLEKLVEKALLARDELQYLIESGDQIADRLSRSAATAVRGDERPVRAENRPQAVPTDAAQVTRNISPASSPPVKTETAPASKAEKELLQALQKLN